MSEMSEEDFAQKVQWEGGALAALEYGLHWKQVEPGQLRDNWKLLEEKYNDLHPLEIRVDNLICDLTDKADD